MGAGILISMEEYLDTAYSPDREYVDGRIVERNLGERDHSRPQRKLIGFFFERESRYLDAEQHKVAHRAAAVIGELTKAAEAKEKRHD